MTDLLTRASELLAAEIKVAMDAVRLGDTALQQSVEVQREGNFLLVLTNYYGEYVIRGRKPGGKKVPISALLRWVKQKGLQGRDKKGRYISSNSLAYAIQTAIFKRGIKGRDFITPAVDSFMSSVQEDLAGELAQEVGDALDELVGVNSHMGF